MKDLGHRVGADFEIQTFRRSLGLECRLIRSFVQDL